MVQADGAGLLQYWQAINSIMELLSKIINNQIFKSSILKKHKAVFTSAFDYLSGRWGELKCSTAVSAAAYLAGQRGGKLSCSVSDTHAFFDEYAYDLLSLAGVIPHHLGHSTVTIRLRSQLQQMEKSEGPWTLNSDEQSKQRSMLVSDPILYYKRRSRMEECNPLASLAVIMLSIAPSEAAVERTFSSLKGQWTALRNQLTVDTVECLLHLQLNHRKLRDASGMVGAVQPSTKYFLLNPLVGSADDPNEQVLVEEDEEEDVL